MVLYLNGALYMACYLQDCTNFIKYLPKSTQYVSRFFFPIPAMQMIWSPNIVCLHFLNIFHISFMKTQYPTDVRLPCPSPTLESGSHRLFPLGCPSQSILLSYHSLNALFWYSVFYEVVHNGPDRSIFLPPRTSPCTLSMGFT